MNNQLLDFKSCPEQHNTPVIADDLCTQSNRLIAIGELTAGIAHNFGNVLMSVSATLELIHVRANKDESLSDMLEIISGAEERVVRGAEIIQRLLSLSKESPFIITGVDVKEAVDNAFALCALHPSAKRIQIINDIPCNAPLVKADSCQLEEIIVNLTLNALQASDGGCIRIGMEDGEANCANIYVNDEGRGIAAEDLQLIFEPFFSKRKSGTTGTGLGLPCVQAQIKRMGGAISVRSQLGHGSIFTIALPKW